MSIKLKRVLASFLSLAVLGGVVLSNITTPVRADNVASYEVDSITYSLSSSDGVNEATVVEYNGSQSSLTIPDVIVYNDTEYVVTGIGTAAFVFKGGAPIYSAHIPDSVTFIGDGAFAGQNRLEEVNFPESLETIGVSAFAGTMIGSVEIPVSVQSIGEMAFAGNTYLLKVDNESADVNISSQAFSGCSYLTNFTINNGNSVESDAFVGCAALNLKYPCTFDVSNLVLPESASTSMYHAGHEEGAFCPATAVVNCVGHSITLDSMIGVNFYFEISDGILNNPAAEVQFTCNGEPYCSTPISSYEIYNYIDNSNEESVDCTCYIYSCPVAAKQMTDIIEAQIVVPVTDTFTWTSSAVSYSVVEYAGRLSAYDFNDSALNNVVKSMLIYGACAQEYFDYHTDRLAYALDTRDAFVNAVVNGIDDFPVEGTNLIFSNFGRMVTTQGPENGVQMVAADLILGSTTSMGLYFTVPEELADSTITYSVNGVNYEARRVGDRMYIRVNDIQPFNLVAAYPIEVSVNGAPQSEYPMLFSPSAYAYLVAEMVDDSAAPASLQNLMRAMFLFGAYSYVYNK